MARSKSTLGLVLGLAFILSDRSLRSQENANGGPVADVGATSGPSTNSRPGIQFGPSTPTLSQADLTVELKLFNDLAEEHRQRADAATRGGKTELADWESSIEKEFRARAASAERALRELANQPFPETRKPNTEPPALSVKKAVSAPEEIAFFAKLNERLSQVANDIAAAVETGKNLALQMTTNNNPDHAVDLSNLMQNNGRDIRDLQREQWYVEMKKLEFRALYKERTSTTNAAALVE